jgi:hypothetical protein
VQIQRGGAQIKRNCARTHVDARVELCAALAHDNVADLDQLAAKVLDAETLTGRVATVGRRTTDLLGGPTPLQCADVGRGDC